VLATVFDHSVVGGYARGWQLIKDPEGEAQGGCQNQFHRQYAQKAPQAMMVMSVPSAG